MAKSLLTNVRFSRISLVDKGASQDPKDGSGAHVLIFKRANPADGDETMNLAEITKAVAGLSAEDKQSLQKALGAPAAAEDILKGASPELVALFKASEERAKKAEKDAADNKAAIEGIQKAARTVSLRKRADVFAKLSGDKAVLADVIGACGEELAKKFEEMLGAWEAQVEKVTAPAAGSRGTGQPPAGKAGQSELMKLADEIVTKSGGKTDRAAAIAQVITEHPELYDEHAFAIQRPGSEAN